MFNLPTLTTVILIGMPALWVLYTLIFMFLTRDWPRHDRAQHDRKEEVEQ